jgi:hypothetical protein
MHDDLWGWVVLAWIIFSFWLSARLFNKKAKTDSKMPSLGYYFLILIPSIFVGMVVIRILNPVEVITPTPGRYISPEEIRAVDPCYFEVDTNYYDECLLDNIDKYVDPYGDTGSRD